MAAVTPPGTLWRQSLLNKVFQEGRSESPPQSKTEVLNFGDHNKFDNFIRLFNKVPLLDGRDDVLGYSLRRSSTSSTKSSGKGKGSHYTGKGYSKEGKGSYHYPGESSSSKSSKRSSKRDSPMYRYSPVQTYDFYPIRPVHYIVPASPPVTIPFSTPSLVPRPTDQPNSPTATPSILTSPIQQHTERPVLQPTASPMEPPTASPMEPPTSSPIQQPTHSPSVSPQLPSSSPSIMSTCQWTVCGDVMSTRCAGIFLEPSDHIRLGGNPEGRELAVRCCSETELPNFRQVTDDASCPFAGTQIDGQCYQEVNYQEAMGLCSSIGARLCTKDELERQCAFGTGCDFNILQIWSSTSGASGYFVPGENTFKIVNTGQGDVDIRTTFSCRGGTAGDHSIGIVTYDDTSCSAQCINRIPYTQYRRYCNENPEGVFSFAIPGPFAAGTDLYIGNAAGSFDLECGGNLQVSFE